MADDHFKNRYLLYMATGVIVCCMGYFFAVTFLTVSSSGARYADIILGALIGSGFTALISYFYGSSKGSQDKDAAMKAMADEEAKEK